MVEEKENAVVNNTVTIEEVGPCKKKVIIEIPEETVKKAVDQQYESLRKEAVVPGFRKGRAPRRLLEKRFGKETNEQIKLKLLADASDSAIKDNQLDVLGEPDIDHEKVELPETGSFKFEFEVEVRPEFELPKLDGIEVEKTAEEITEEQIDREIDQLRKYSGVWAPREDGAVEVDDQVIVDAILKIEGVEEEQKLDNTEIFVRKNGFVGSIPVENLDEVLVGAKPGDTKKTSVEVPKTYFKEEYRGKKVDIQIEVKDIKWLKPADIDEPFLERFGVKEEDELRERMRDMLEQRLEQAAKTEMTEQIYKYMLDNTDFDLPMDVVAQQSNMLLQRQFSSLMQRGLDAEKLREEMDNFRASSEEQAKEQLKTYFIMDKVAEKLEIEVTNEEVNGHIAQLAIRRGQRPERLREEMMRDGSLSQFTLQVREDKVISKLLESAKIKEVKTKKTVKKESKKTTKKAQKKSEAKKADNSADKEKKKTKNTKKTIKKKTSE